MPARPVIGLDELDAQHGDLLPDRDTLCYVGCVNVTNVVGVNLAISINAATINSQANAVAMQYLATYLH
ncbi:hypothetical protein [Nocardioides sp. CER19]|uniref:hypothetical protein n=1 Tax=Nocardioides sp. CER19 TaxID=3038538 RepID=UPI002446807F|nr:hypothetical protein [Nocardioides sp. CER19]MDH2413916.1 hypothetical protein [Nocardioides sp. CER19]